MKLKFKNQSFQQMAVDAVADLFLGQERQQSTFQIDAGASQGTLLNEFGVGNALLIDDDRLAANMRDVQKRNNLQQTDDDLHRFCVEMETGTGKTVVYTKTILELNNATALRSLSSSCRPSLSARVFARVLKSRRTTSKLSLTTYPTVTLSTTARSCRMFGSSRYQPISRL